MTSITVQHLPEEIILRVVHHLDTDPVSIRLQQQVPSAALIATSKSECGLKSFSRVSQAWRRIAFPLLFKHIKISADFLISRVLNPAEDPRLAVWNANYNAKALSLQFDEHRLTRVGCFFEWAQSKELNTITESVLLYVTESSPSCVVEESDDSPGTRMPPSIRIQEINRKQLYHWLYSRLLALFTPRNLSLVAPPAAIANMLGARVHLSDLWAFNMPYQRLHLHIGKSGNIADSSKPVHGRLLDYADWKEIDYHAGSCLNLYGTCKISFSMLPL
jgi:hypothetical protein